MARHFAPSRFDDLGPETCVIYLRISQDRSGEQLGVDRQLRECRELARRLGLEVTKVYTDNDISATSGRARPEFEAMLRARPETIVTWHQDRLLRLTADLEKVITLDVPVFTVAAGNIDLSTPAGRAVARTVAAWSQYEGEQKAVRQRAESGTWQFSRRPYGYERTDGRVVVVEAEADIIRELYRRYLAGDTYYALANDLNARGVPTFGGAWSMQRVRQLLRNARYAGYVEYNGERVDVEPQWTPIIDARTWSDYEQMRDGRTRAGEWSTSTKHLLSGLLVCGVCGANLLSITNRGRLVYSCRSSWCVSVDGPDADDFVQRLVLGRLADKRVIAALRHVPDTAPVQAELAALRKRRDDITDLLADGLLDRRKARAQATELTAKIEARTARLAAMRRESPLTDLALARSITTRWGRLSVLDRRRVIQELGLVVAINRGRKGPRPKGSDGQPMLDVRRVEVDWTDHRDPAA